MADDWSTSTKTYEAYSSKLPASVSAKSALFLQSTGLHFDCDIPSALRYVHSAIRHFSTLRVPHPINLWMSLHAPGENKAKKYIEKQGRKVVAALNKGVAEEVERISPEGEIVEGRAKIFPTYNITEGAESFDGTHYSYQVSLSHFFLDLIWL
jgi:hypothetical protein